MIVTLQNMERFKGRKYLYCCEVHGSSLPIATTGPSVLKLSKLIPSSTDRWKVWLRLAQALPVAVLNTLTIVGILGKHREQLSVMQYIY